MQPQCKYCNTKVSIANFSTPNKLSLYLPKNLICFKILTDGYKLCYQQYAISFVFPFTRNIRLVVAQNYKRTMQYCCFIGDKKGSLKVIKNTQLYFQTLVVVLHFSVVYHIVTVKKKIRALTWVNSAVVYNVYFQFQPKHQSSLYCIQTIKKNFKALI